MQTVIGRFESKQDAQNAINQLNSFNLGRTEVAAKDQRGAVVESKTGPRTMWDFLYQITISVGCLVGAFFGLLAGAGVFDHMGAGGVTARSVWAGILVGVGIGGMVGMLVGPFIAGARPERQSHFHAAPIIPGALVVTVQTDDQWTRDAVNIMRNAHALNVDTRKGKVDANKFAEENIKAHA